MTVRAMVFVDGFNLYHSIDNDRRFHKYKWLDLNALAKPFLTSTETLEKVHYFTAYTHWNPSRQSRHHAYVTVLQNTGVEVTLGQFIAKQRTSRVRCGHPCRGHAPNGVCGQKFTAHEEKMTDVNIAVSILKAAVCGDCESIYLVSGDNDLVPALETAKLLVPTLHVRVLLPINAKAKRIMAACKRNQFKYMRINDTHLAKAQFPDQVLIRGRTFSRPSHWH